MTCENSTMHHGQKCQLSCMPGRLLRSKKTVRMVEKGGLQAEDLAQAG